MAKEGFHGPLEKVDECCYRIPKSYRQGMLVDGLIFTNEKMLAALRKDQAPDQVANVAFIPGIQHASLAMPDIHWGYGFCIGGVCATDPDEGGVISPGVLGTILTALPPTPAYCTNLVTRGRLARWHPAGRQPSFVVSTSSLDNAAPPKFAVGLANPAGTRFAVENPGR